MSRIGRGRYPVQGDVPLDQFIFSRRSFSLLSRDKVNWFVNYTFIVRFNGSFAFTALAKSYMFNLIEVEPVNVTWHAVILKVLNVLEYGSISPNRTLNVIVEFCNLKFLSIRSNVKKVASSALYKWFAILSQVRRADRKGQSRKIRAEWSSSLWAT